jgi:hypothetical protein
MKLRTTTRVVQLAKRPTGGSDATLKQDISTIDNVLSKILALRPVTWYWKSDKKRSTLNYGFVAQEVEKILPNLVSIETWEDGTDRKHLSTNDITPYLVAAIQEQQKQIDKLRAELDKR